MRKFSAAFTIVELLVVIVVIAILASISIVAYNGAQDRAEFAKAQTDLRHINDALTVYKSQNGSYPSTGGSTTYTYQYAQSTQALNTSFLSALVPSYLDKMPLGTTKSGYNTYSYAYVSDGTDYKLLRMILRASPATTPSNGLPSVERSGNLMLDPNTSRTASDKSWSIAWGYWTTGASSW